MHSNGRVQIGRLAVVGIALLCIVVIVVSVLPIPVTIKGGHFLSIGTSYPTQANPSFTARAETYFDAESLSSPYDATVDKPTGTAEGDILFAAIFWIGSVAIDSTPSGWTKAGDYTDNTDKYALYYKVAGASEPSTYTWSFDGSCKVRVACSCYTSGDFDAGDPIDVVSNTAYRLLTTTVRAASMSVSETDSPLIFFAMGYSSVSESYTKPSTPTSDWVEDDDAGSTTSDGWIEICSMIWSGSGATGDMDATRTYSSQYKHAFAVALNPAGAEPPGDPSDLTDTAHNGDSIDLSWTKGTNSDKTLIRYRTDQYPTSTSDGTQAYFDTGVSTTVESLDYGQIYYFRAWAYNTTNDLYSTGTSDKTCFTDPNSPTSFNVTETTCAGSIALSWSKGTGADKTRIQYRTDQYPTTYSDGTQAYFDTGTSTNVTSLNVSLTYYFRAWSYDTESGYYDSYAELTQGFDCEEPNPEITNTPSSNDFGTLEVNGTGSTAIDYFQIENTGNCAVDVVIYGTNATGDATEEQTDYSTYDALRSGADSRAGQKLTISNRTVAKLSFLLAKHGSPTGNVTLAIRKVSDDSIIASKVWGDASALNVDTPIWEEVTFDSPILINEEVRIYAEYIGGDNNNHVRVYFKTSDVKASENYVEYNSSGNWVNLDTYDCAYIYTYQYTWDLNDTATPGENIYGLKAQVGSTEQLFESSNSTDYQVQSAGSLWHGQAFTTTTGHNITKVKLKLYRVGSPETITVSIRNASSSLPTGGDLCSGTTDGDTLTTDTAGEWRTITFDSSYSLEDSTQYAIVLRALSGTLNTHTVYWKDDSYGNPYANGTGSVSQDSGSSWSNEYYGTCDFTFQEYGYIYEETVVKRTSPYNTLVSNLAINATQDWGLKLWMPTSLSGYDGQNMTATITLVVSEAS